jgi:hypothetical protein
MDDDVTVIVHGAAAVAAGRGGVTKVMRVGLCTTTFDGCAVPVHPVAPPIVTVVPNEPNQPKLAMSSTVVPPLGPPRVGVRAWMAGDGWATAAAAAARRMRTAADAAERDCLPVITQCSCRVRRPPANASLYAGVPCSPRETHTLISTTAIARPNVSRAHS